MLTDPYSLFSIPYPEFPDALSNPEPPPEIPSIPITDYGPGPGASTGGSPGFSSGGSPGFSGDLGMGPAGRPFGSFAGDRISGSGSLGDGNAGTGGIFSRLNPNPSTYTTTYSVMIPPIIGLESSLSKLAGILTRFGFQRQSSSLAAKVAWAEARSGATLMRSGKLGKSAAGESQFWSLESPLSPQYPSRMGLPQVETDFIIGGTLRPSARMITNEATPLGLNPGGAFRLLQMPTLSKIFGSICRENASEAVF